MSDDMDFEEGGTIKKFMFVNRKAPYGTIYALEGLEVVLISAAFDQYVSLAFVDDGVFQLIKGQKTDGVGMSTIHSEEKQPISRVLIRLYEPVPVWTLRWKWAVIAVAFALVIATIPVYFKLGSEFMPPLEEGSILYMPTTMPGISITEAQKLLQVTDRIIKQFPEVDRVLGKAGRAETSTDPAPLSMLETVIILKPKSEWRRADTWYSSWAPEWVKAIFRHITPDHISQEELTAT